MSVRSETETEVSGKFKLVKRIGGGAFGEIYKGLEQGTKTEYAIKVEPANAKLPQLYYEYKLYKLLCDGSGFPKVFWFGVVGENNMMVMELLGPSIEDLFRKCHQCFSLKTGIMIADQMIRRVEFLHSKCFVHRDIKPENFCVGLSSQNGRVYLIDMGLAKRYRDLRTKMHIPFTEHLSLTGTARYASTNALLGHEQSRRDDLESIGYCLIYLLKGSLPWQSVDAVNKIEKYEKIAEKKLSISIDNLCKGLPIEFNKYLTYCRTLRFDDKPDYGYLLRLFSHLYEKEGYRKDHVYDWMLAEKDRPPTFRDRKLAQPQEQTPAKAGHIVDFGFKSGNPRASVENKKNTKEECRDSMFADVTQDLEVIDDTLEGLKGQLVGYYAEYLKTFIDNLEKDKKMMRTKQLAKQIDLVPPTPRVKSSKKSKKSKKSNKISPAKQPPIVAKTAITATSTKEDSINEVEFEEINPENEAKTSLPLNSNGSAPIVVTNKALAPHHFIGKSLLTKASILSINDSDDD